MKYASACCILAIVAVLIVGSMSRSPLCLAADYTKVGLAVGNTADYATSASYQTYNKTHLLIYGIVGTLIYGNYTDYNIDGSVNDTYQIVADVLAGGYYTYTRFIAANLTAGDPVYSSASMTINETIQMNVSGIQRSVNHLNIPSGYLDVYWDQATGLMTKLNLWLFGWLNMTLISTDAWSPVTPPPPPPTVSAPFAVKLSGEFDYGNKESVDIRLAALVKDSTMKPISNATVIIQIYYPNGTLWITGIMQEKLAGTGIYEWESFHKIDKMKLTEGVYLVHVEVFPGGDPLNTDMMLFHIDPPPQNDPPPPTAPYYAASTIGLAAAVIAGIYLFKRQKKP
jgi:hypothetical protein